jgi:hypothetical protein
MAEWAPIATTILTGLFVILGYLLNQRSSRRERKAEFFADALRAVKEFEELPYRILRRSDSTPQTREHVGTEIDDCFTKLSFYQTWLFLDSPRVGDAYQQLASKCYSSGEPHRADAWSRAPVASDAEAHLADDYVFGAGVEWANCIRVMRRELRPWSWRGSRVDNLEVWGRWQRVIRPGQPVAHPAAGPEAAQHGTTTSGSDGDPERPRPDQPGRN